MYDFVGVEVVHATGDLLGPVQYDSRGDLLAIAEQFIQLSIGAVLHYNTVTWSLGADTPKKYKQ